MPTNEIKAVQSWEEIGTCTDAFPLDECMLRVVDTGAPNPMMACFNEDQFLNSKYDHMDPTLEQYNQSVYLIKAQGFKQICHSLDLLGFNHIYASKTDPTMPGIQSGPGQQSSVLPKEMDLPFCGAQFNDPYKKRLEHPLNTEEAHYLASKFPALIDGCSVMGNDGSYYFNLLTDPGSINPAIESIQEDIEGIDKKSLPQGVSKEFALRIIEALENVRAQDQSEMQKEAQRLQKNIGDRQINAVKTGIHIQIAMGGAQLLMTGAIIYIFVQNLKIAKEMAEINKKLMEDKAGKIEKPLERFGRNLNEDFRSGRAEPVNIELRADEIWQIRQSLMDNRSVYLTGEAGVGKTALVEGLAAGIEMGLYPTLKGTEIVMLDINVLESGTKWRGSFEERLQSVMDALAEQNIYSNFENRLQTAFTEFKHSFDLDVPLEEMSDRQIQNKVGPYTRMEMILESMLKESQRANGGHPQLEKFLNKALEEVREHRDKEIAASLDATIEETIRLSESGKRTILFIDELHRIMGAGKAEGKTGAADVLKTPLSRGDIVLLGATTNKEFLEYIAPDNAMMRRGDRVDVRPLTAKETIVALQKKMVQIGAPKRHFPEMKISYEALQELVYLGDVYITDQQFPGKGDAMLRRAVSNKRLECENNPQAAAELSVQDIHNFFKTTYKMSVPTYEEYVALYPEYKLDAAIPSAQEILADIGDPFGLKTVGVQFNAETMKSILDQLKKLLPHVFPERRSSIANAIYQVTQDAQFRAQFMDGLKVKPEGMAEALMRIRGESGPASPAGPARPEEAKGSEDKGKDKLDKEKKDKETKIHGK